MSRAKRNRIQTLYEAFSGSPWDHSATAFVFLNDSMEPPVYDAIFRNLSEKGFAHVALSPRSGLSVPFPSRAYWQKLAGIVGLAKARSLRAWICVDYQPPVGPFQVSHERERPDLRARGLVFRYGKRADSRRTVVGTYVIRGRSVTRLPGPRPGKRSLMALVDVLGSQSARGADARSIPRGGMGILDILNPEAVRYYIDTVLEPFRKHLKKYFGDTIEGILVQSPQNQCPFPWTDALPVQFKDRFGYDILACLPALFEAVDDYITVRTDYYRLVADLTGGFYRDVGTWAGRNGLSFSATIGREGFIETLPHAQGDPYTTLSEMTVPATSYRCTGRRNLSDAPPLHLSNYTPKFVSSVARIRKDDRALAAIWEGEGWGVTPQQLKRTVDCGVSLGINSFLTHGVFASLVGLRKRDFPPSVYRQQPYWENASILTDYISRTCLMMSAGHSRADTLVLFPRTSLWAHTVGLGRLTKSGNRIVAEFGELIARLLSDQRDFDFLYEQMLEGRLVRCGNGAIAIGPNRYSTLIIPRATHIPESTLAFTERARECGVTVIFIGDYPAVIGRRRPVIAGTGITLVRDTADLLHYLGLNVPKQLYFLGANSDKFLHQRRSMPGADIYFLSYLGQDRFSGTLALAGAGTPEAWDPEDGHRYCIPEFQVIEGGVCFPVTFEQGKSWIYVIHSEHTDALRGLPASPEHRAGEFFIPGRWDVDYRSDNMLRIDNFRLIRSLPPVSLRPLRDLVRDGRFGPLAKLMIASMRVFTESVGRVWGIRRKIGYRSYTSMEREMGHYSSVARLTRMDVRCQTHDRKLDMIRDAARYMGLFLSTPLPPEGSEYEIEANFMVGTIPERISLVWEDTGQPTDIFVNGILVSDREKGCFVWDGHNRCTSLSAVVRWGTNRIGIRSRQPDFPTVIPAIHCLEPVVIVGDFEVNMDIITAKRETTRHLSWGRRGTGNYSGTVTYRSRFRVPRRQTGKVSILDLGDVRVACRVVLNGRDMGVRLWPPYRYDITDALLSGENEIEVSVTNTTENLLGIPAISGIVSDPKIVFFNPR